MHYLYTRRSSMSLHGFILMAQKMRLDMVYRRTMFGGEAVVGTTKFLFTRAEKKKSMGSLYLFSMVKKDAIRWCLARKGKLAKLPEHPQMHTRPRWAVKGRPIVAADIDSAYWEIARSLGIISQETHDRGLSINNKELMLSTLSSIGRERAYTVMKDGRDAGIAKRVVGADGLKDCYHRIRLTCYGYMMSLAEELGSDFLAYKTDCIYFYYTKKNVKLIKDFFDSKKVSYKFSDKVPEELYE